MLYIIGDYNPVTRIGTACRASIPKVYKPESKGFSQDDEIALDIAEGDVINFVNLVFERIPVPGTTWRLTPSHSFEDRHGEIYYCSAKLDKTSRLFSNAGGIHAERCATTT